MCSRCGDGEPHTALTPVLTGESNEMCSRYGDGEPHTVLTSVLAGWSNEMCSRCDDEIQLPSYCSYFRTVVCTRWME
jgi:hypothetical protein